LEKAGNAQKRAVQLWLLLKNINNFYKIVKASNLSPNTEEQSYEAKIQIIFHVGCTFFNKYQQL